MHADFSPKNVLITDERIVLVDFETGHLGDPAFDLGFFLSHLLLKTVLRPATDPRQYPVPPGIVAKVITGPARLMSTWQTLTHTVDTASVDMDAARR